MKENVVNFFQKRDFQFESVTCDGLLEDIANFRIEFIDSTVEKRGRYPIQTADTFLNGQITFFVIAGVRAKQFFVQQSCQVAFTVIQQGFHRAVGHVCTNRGKINDWNKLLGKYNIT